MIKMIAIRFASFGILALLFLSLGWVEQISVWHAIIVMFYFILLPLTWLVGDWIFGVNRVRRKQDTAFGQAPGSDLWVNDLNFRCSFRLCRRR